MSQPAGNQPDPTELTAPALPSGSVPSEPTTAEEAYDYTLTFFDAVDKQRTMRKLGATAADAFTYLAAYAAIVVPSADKTTPAKSLVQTVHVPANEYPAFHATGAAATMILKLQRPSDGAKERLEIHSAALAYRIAGSNKVNVAHADIQALASAVNGPDGAGGYVPQPESYYILGGRG